MKEYKIRRHGEKVDRDEREVSRKSDTQSMDIAKFLHWLSSGFARPGSKVSMLRIIWNAETIC